jgi:uncharacterized membrane protein YcaP (DUF421 family)
MNAILSTLFGEGTDLTVIQMVARGVTVFIFTLLMLRVSGRRSFGQHSPFDACITVLLGSILARAVAGASPFLPTIASGMALVLLHRAIAMISIRSPSMEKLVSGSPRTLVSNGELVSTALHKGLVSQADILQALREHAHAGSIADARLVTLERNGTISVLLRPEDCA